MLFLFLTASPARAGHYEVSYAGGSWSHTGSGAQNYFLSQEGNWGGGGYQQIYGSSGTISGNASGTITATFTWKNGGNAEDVPPDKVLVRQQCNATWGVGGDNYKDASGDRSHGLTADSVVATTDPDGPTGGNVTATGYSLLTNPGASFQVTASPSANSTCSLQPPFAVATAGVGVSYRAEAVIPYVSGTYSAYPFRVPDNFTGTMTTFNVKLNGAEVYTGSGPTAWSQHTGVRYDSTHFADGTTLKFVTTINNTDGKQFKCEDWYIVYNKYSVRQCSDYTNYSDVAASIAGTLAAMNHAPVGSSTGYTKSDFLADCKRATAIHFSLHGTSTYLSHLSPPPTQADKVTATEISAAIYKISWRPPINIVFGAACSTCASGATIPGSFGIPASGAVNRAYVGFDRDGWIVGLQAAADEFWAVLKNGIQGDTNARTVATAREVAQAIYNDVNMQKVMNGEASAPADCVVIGDSAATLFGLYKRTEPHHWVELY
jgi:hypothetical protein